MTRRGGYEMVQRRATEAGLETAIGCYACRATGITNHLVNGGMLEKAQQLANHMRDWITILYDRQDNKLPLNDVERIATGS